LLLIWSLFGSGLTEPAELASVFSGYNLLVIYSAIQRN